jgi:hypothetical protein
VPSIQLWLLQGHWLQQNPIFLLPISSIWLHLSCSLKLTIPEKIMCSIHPLCIVLYMSKTIPPYISSLPFLNEYTLLIKHYYTVQENYFTQCFEVSSTGIWTQCTLSIKWANWKWTIHVTMMKECILCLMFWLNQICLLLFSQFPKYQQTKRFPGR